MKIRADNYENPLWSLVYDRHDRGRHERELAYFRRVLAGVEGPLLECACGTGWLLVELLAAGFDVRGFDISVGMLNTLHARMKAAGRSDGRRLISRQDLVQFRYEEKFAAILIPSRAFLHLATQDDQIACLANCRAHLAEGGRLLVNFFNVDHGRLIADAGRAPGFRPVGTYPHPDDPARTIELETSQTNDLVAQVMNVTWRYRTGVDEAETKMVLRWVYPEEFRLLLRLAGFSRAEVLGDFDGAPLAPTSSEQVWTAWS